MEKETKGSHRSGFRSGHWTVGRAGFGSTRWSLVLQAGRQAEPDAEAVEEWCRIYWYPVYCFIRRQGKAAEDARDLTQEFFGRLLEKQWLAVVEPGPARFRTWLLVVLKRFLADAHDYATAAKRGGGRLLLPVDVPEVEARLEREGAWSVEPEGGFDRQWAVRVLEQGVACLAEECAAAGKADLFDALGPFLSRDPGPGEYTGLASRLGRREGAVRMAVSRLRSRYRDCLKSVLLAEAGPDADPEVELRECLAALTE